MRLKYRRLMGFDARYLNKDDYTIESIDQYAYVVKKVITTEKRIKIYNYYMNTKDRRSLCSVAKDFGCKHTYLIMMGYMYYHSGLIGLDKFTAKGIDPLRWKPYVTMSQWGKLLIYDRNVDVLTRNVIYYAREYVTKLSQRERGRKIYEQWRDNLST